MCIRDRGKTIPLVFVGLACAYSNRGGLFNIGCEGQLYIGGLAATVTALQMQGMPRALVLAATFVTVMLSGGLAGGVTGFLKAKLNINEVLVAIMLNYILKFFASYCVHGPIQEMCIRDRSRIALYMISWEDCRKKGFKPQWMTLGWGILPCSS